MLDSHIPFWIVSKVEDLILSVKVSSRTLNPVIVQTFTSRFATDNELKNFSTAWTDVLNIMCHQGVINMLGLAASTGLNIAGFMSWCWSSEESRIVAGRRIKNAFKIINYIQKNTY